MSDVVVRTERYELFVGLFICACGHAKASHRPHGGRRKPLSPWICRKKDCPCTEYGQGEVEIVSRVAGE